MKSSVRSIDPSQKSIPSETMLLLNNSRNAKDLGLSPKSYAQLVHQEQMLQELGEVASFGGDATEDDVSFSSDQVIIKK